VDRIIDVGSFHVEKKQQKRGAGLSWNQKSTGLSGRKMGRKKLRVAQILLMTKK